MSKNVLYFLLFLGLGVYYGYDTYYPEYVAWSAEIEELSKNIDQARRTAPKLASIKKEEALLQQRLTASLDKLPSGAELDNLLIMVTPILESVGIQSSQIGGKNVDAAVEDEIYRTHGLRFSEIKGVSMQTVVRLLFELRNFHRIINVKSYHLARTGPDEYTLNLDLETYSYKAAEGEIVADSAVEVPITVVPPPEVISDSSADSAAESETTVHPLPAVATPPARAASDTTIRVPAGRDTGAAGARSTGRGTSSSVAADSRTTASSRTETSGAVSRTSGGRR